MFNRYKKQFIGLGLTLLLVVVFFGVGYEAGAVSWKDVVSGVVGHLVQFLIWIMGGILFVLIYILIWVAQYNEFINSNAVSYGWYIVRDLCNMFFILILLVIAFATILRVESYSVKRLLPKLLIMAVLINFSKTICGLIIDFAQVIMLTFVDGFKGLGSANLTEMLGINELLAININATTEVAGVSSLAIIGSYILALLYTIISIIVVLVLVFVLVMRMIMIWVYVVLSPLAFLLSAFPNGQGYASQWWSRFTKEVVVGPVLAFFIWLSFTSLGVGSTAVLSDNIKPGNMTSVNSVTGESVTTDDTANNTPLAGATEAGTPDNMIKFIISIGMLMGGLMVTQQIGGMAGAAAGRGLGAINQGKAAVARFAQRKAIGAATTVGQSALGTARVADRLMLGGRGERFAQNVGEHKGAAIIGAGLGAFGGVPGGIAGAAVAVKIAKKFKAKRDKQKDLRQKIADGVNSGNINHDNKDYKKHENGHFYQVNKAGQYVKRTGEAIKAGEDIKEHGNNFQTDAGLSRFTKSDYNILGAEGYKTAYNAYSSASNKTNAVAKAAKADKVSKAQNDYKNMTTDTLHGQFEIEEDSIKKMAIALTLAARNGFKNTPEGLKSLSKAKEAVSGNAQISSQFADEMVKRNAALYHTEKVGTEKGADGKEQVVYKINEAAFEKGISSGKFNLASQDIKNMNKEDMMMWSKTLGADFHKQIESAIRTTDDKNKAVEILSKTIPSPGERFNDKDTAMMGIRKSFGVLSGDFLKAFSIPADAKGDKIQEKGEFHSNYQEMVKQLGMVTDLKVFASMDEKQLKESAVLKKAVVDSVNKAMLIKMQKGNDMDKTKTELFVNTVFENGDHDTKQKIYDDDMLNTSISKDLMKGFEKELERLKLEKDAKDKAEAEAKKKSEGGGPKGKPGTEPKSRAGFT